MEKEKQLENVNIDNSNFTFTISDGYCIYSYPLNISSNNSVDEIATKIYKAFKLKKEIGTYIKLK